MQRNFFGFDPSYHVARHHFDPKTSHSRTPRHLTIHRELGWVVPKVEARGEKGPATWRALCPSLGRA